VREIDLAVYADALAGESAALSARAERIRSRLRQAKIERRARNDLAPATVDRLEALGLLGGTDGRGAHAELRELEDSLAALEELQGWVEASRARGYERALGVACDAATKDVRALPGRPSKPETARARTFERVYERGVSATKSPPSSSYAGKKSAVTAFSLPVRVRSSSCSPSRRTPHSSANDAGFRPSW
jgi:hypothetical protein